MGNLRWCGRTGLARLCDTHGILTLTLERKGTEISGEIKE